MDLVFKNITNFALIGTNPCTITCVSPVSIMLINVTDFKLSKISLINCTKIHSLTGYNTSILLYHCTSFIMDKMDITVNSGTIGLLVVNTVGSSRIAHVRIRVNYLSCPSLNRQTNGVLLYYNDFSWNTHNATVKFNIDNLQYITDGLCTENIITILLSQKRYNVSVNICNTIFKDLKNSSALYYYGETCGLNVKSDISISNCTVRDNIGNHQLKMFDIVLNNSHCINTTQLLQYYKQQYSSIYFINCTFTNNTDMEAIIYVTPASSRTITGYIKVWWGGFFNNRDVNFIKVKAKTEIIWQLTTHLSVKYINVSYNKHHNGEGLITMTNGVIYFVGPMCFIKNDYYETIIKAHLTVVACKGNINLTRNYARQILTAKHGSYFLLLENTTINISENIHLVIMPSLFVQFNFTTQKATLIKT